jgi:eukaryotic-like serine/threonine-protein kinase
MLGTTIYSRYQIIKFLGMGRSGSTYLAENLDLPNCPLCSIEKFQPPEIVGMAAPLIDKLFESQATILQKIGQHPQIPTLTAKFQEYGNRYLVSEYINGDLLSEELAIGSTWSQTQVFDFLLDLANILSFIHSFQYIHQNLNPKNIIRRKDDGRFIPVDFSAIKDLNSVWHQISKHDPRYVKIAIGTPGYIPSEQEQNSPQYNSDIYAVGVIAIQALTGEFPILKDALTQELKWRDRVNIDLRLMNIIDKMVRSDCRNRYQSAAEVLQDLQAFALTQIPPSKLARFKPYLVFSAAACLLFIGFGTLKLLFNSDEKPISSTFTIGTEKLASNNYPIPWPTYIDVPAKFKIKSPPTWRVNNIQNSVTGEIVAFISPVQSSTDKYQENVSVRVEQLTNPQITLAEYTKSNISKINSYYKDVKIIESSSISMAKTPANLVVYTGTDENALPIENLEVWTIDRDRAYIVTYRAEPQQYYVFLQIVMTMINSFELN